MSRYINADKLEDTLNEIINKTPLLCSNVQLGVEKALLAVLQAPSVNVREKLHPNYCPYCGADMRDCGEENTDE